MSRINIVANKRHKKIKKLKLAKINKHEPPKYEPPKPKFEPPKTRKDLSIHGRKGRSK